MSYCVKGSGYFSPLLVLPSVKILEVAELKDFEFKAENKVYVPSEDVLTLVAARIGHENNQAALELFKDKVLFREFIRPLFKDFYFKKINLSELAKVKLDFTQQHQYIIKPAKGFFGVGVRIINAATDLNQLQQELQNEISEKLRYFSGGMLSADAFIIESFIGGVPGSDLNNLENAELAVDLYYNKHGKPVIVGIYHHPASLHQEYFHTLYYMSAHLFELEQQLLDFFTGLQDLGLGVSNFPLHAEFKLVRGQLLPIEINPYRFGGFGLADTPNYAFGFNPFQAFFEDYEPNWQALWKTHSDHYYAWVLAYNGTHLDTKINKPDAEKFKAFLGAKLLAYQAMDYKTQPVFAIAYIAATSQKDLTEILQLDFNDYLISA